MMGVLAFDISSGRGDIQEMDVGNSLPTAGLSRECSSPGMGTGPKGGLEAAEEEFSAPWSLGWSHPGAQGPVCHTHGLSASGVTWEQPGTAVSGS